MKIKNGCYRKVFIFRKFVVKIPQASYQWRHFVNGVLCNINEGLAYRNHPRKDLMCRVVFRNYGGLFLVMERADTEKHLLEVESGRVFNYSEFISNGLGGDDKPDNYGYMGDRLVKIDYQ